MAFNTGINTSAIREELGLQRRFVVSYIGTLGMAHDLGTVLEAAACCAQSMAEVVFLLVGEGADKKRLVSLARERQLPNVRFLPQQPRERVPALIAASDVCLVTLRRSEIFKTVIPTKMLEFMSCGKPVVLAVEGQASELLKEAGGGLCIHPEDASAIANAVRQLYENPMLCQSLGNNGRRYIEENLSRERTAEAYIPILQALTQGQSSRLETTNALSATDL